VVIASSSPFQVLGSNHCQLARALWKQAGRCGWMEGAGNTADCLRRIRLVKEMGFELCQELGAGESK
jgi:hypothetical protein